MNNLLGSRNQRTRTISNNIPRLGAQDCYDPLFSVVRPQTHGHDTIGIGLVYGTLEHLL